MAVRQDVVARVRAAAAAAVGLAAGVLLARRRREDELDDLRRADRVKSDFISVASHELRAPAAVVHGISATLHTRAGELPPDQAEELRAALYAESLRLRRLIDQLLDVSRIESGAICVRARPFRPRALVDALVQRLADGARPRVRVELPPELEVETDPDAFERVVGNLVANALAYGRPPVVVRSREGSSFSVIVEDRGEGVPEEFVGDLFERFTRADRARLEHHPGAGLGLSIARSYAEAVGGTLHYETAEPHGARFVLELPDALPLRERRLDGAVRTAPPL